MTTDAHPRRFDAVTVCFDCGASFLSVHYLTVCPVCGGTDMEPQESEYIPNTANGTQSKDGRV